MQLSTTATGMPFLKKHAVTHTGILLLLVGLGVWLYQLSMLWFWQQDLQHKLAQQNTPTIIAAPEQKKPLLISNIVLPALPQTRSVQPKEKLTTAAPEQIQDLSKPVKIEPKKQPSPEKVKLTSQATTPTNKVDAKAVLQQLQSSTRLDLQIALPQNAAQRERLLGYLYRCSGAQFAVLQQQQLVYLSPKRYVATSKWLRVVSGSLSAQEQAWLGNHLGQPVRLLPQAVDQRLANYIANTLQGAPLHSLRAQYTLTDSGLALTNVMLNQQTITSPWPLHQSRCR